MIYRIVVSTSKRDFLRSAVDRFFQDYLIIQADKYSNNTKSMSLIVEIDAKDDAGDLDKIHKTVDEVAKVLGVPASLHMFRTGVLKSSVENPIKYQGKQSFKKEEDEF